MKKYNTKDKNKGLTMELHFTFRYQSILFDIPIKSLAYVKLSTLRIYGNEKRLITQIIDADVKSIGVNPKNGDLFINVPLHGAYVISSIDWDDDQSELLGFIKMAVTRESYQKILKDIEKIKRQK